MNIGVKVSGQLIVDERFLKFTNLETAIGIKRSSLLTAISDEGLALYELSNERKITWEDDTTQIRQKFTLILTKKLTKNQIYSVINSVEAQPLKFSK